ncbi:UNVERIFIED_CONTAM: Pre-processing protein 40A [Sesamum radiatum]|uniref:Pre-processing protein 40A n=1 Tax=Sesamum radiatum TaxID=300843 RepID=A0AAW2U7U2_SESRA
MSMQFRPVAPPPPPQPFVPVPPQQFQPGGHSNMGMPPHPPPIQYPQAVPPPQQQPPPQRPSLPGHGLPQGPPLPPPDFQPNRPVMSAPPQPQISNNFMPSFGGPRISHVSYSLSSSSGGQQQINVVSTAQHLPMAQTEAPNFSAVGQPWYPTGNQNVQPVLPMQQPVEQSAGEQTWSSTVTQNIKPVTPLQQNGEQNAGAQQWFPSGNQNVQSNTPQQNEEQSASLGKNTLPDLAKTDWREYTSRDGKKYVTAKDLAIGYYYNKRTRVSLWEKPLELMTPTERADASTDWREINTPEGRRFYYNKVTKQSKWAIPDEVKLARERANMTSSEGTPTIKDVNSYASAAVSVSGTEVSNHNADNLSCSATEMVSSPVSVTPPVNPELAAASGSSSIQEEVANLKSDATGVQTPVEIATSTVVSDPPVPVAMATSMSTPMRISNKSPQDAAPSSVDTFAESVEGADTSAGISGIGGNNAPEVKKVEHGPLVYESKEEAKNAFKALLETANVGSDWNWDQFIGQKKKQEAEEKRARQKKARENFKKMLQESKDLTSSTRWSKAISMFEKDERFQAVERAKDREDLFEDHLEELKKKERAKALEEHKRHKAEYLEFLKSCDFIKASSQWRKVQNRLEADERCSRLEKVERLEIFQEYIRDLEMEEEEQRKLRLEEQRKAERKNRDEFRKLMEEHVASGILTANSHWRDYCMKVKDAPAYLAVSSNTSGSTAKDLFDDVIEDLEKQYMEDKERIEEAIKTEKISLSMNWTFEDFKGALPKEISPKPISDINLKLIFEELLEITKEKGEKEAKKRKRLAEDIYEFLFTSKEITSSSKWEDCRALVEERFVGEESFFREIFDKVILELKEKAKGKERKRKEEKAKKEKEKERKDKDKKEKERKNKDRGESRKGKERYKIDETDSDESESYSLEEKKRSKDKNKKHQKRSMGSFDDMSLDDDEKDRSRSHRHSGDSKKPKQKEKDKQTWSAEADSESQSKRHKKDHWDASDKNTDHEENKDGEFGEDGEVQ